MLRFPAFVILAVCLFLAGCDRSRARIAGKWKVENSGMVWDFAPNGVVKAGDTEGRYSFGDQSRLKIITPTATFVYQIDFKDDVMIWQTPSGARTELKRVP